MDKIKVYRGEGCVECRGTGYFGRTGIFEMMTIDSDLDSMIQQTVDSRDIMRKAKEAGMMTLNECAVRKLMDGSTSFEEVIRVTGL